MKYLYSLHDVKTDKWYKPVVCNNDGEAERSFISAVNGDYGKDGDVVKYPQDFRLVCLGTFDDQLGVIEGIANVEIINGETAIKKIKYNKMRRLEIEGEEGKE